MPWCDQTYPLKRAFSKADLISIMFFQVIWLYAQVLLTFLFGFWFTKTSEEVKLVAQET